MRLFAADAAVRDEPTFSRGGWSESGDLEALAEIEGAERRPERLVSRGDRGGPMAALWAIARRKKESEPCKLFGASQWHCHVDCTGIA